MHGSLKEDDKRQLLVGGVDEITPIYVQILDDLDRVKKGLKEGEDIEHCDTDGMVLGEGAVFFLMAAAKTEQSLGVIRLSRLINKPKTTTKILEQVTALLAENNLTIDDIDLVLPGNNGNVHHDALLNQLLKEQFEAHPKLYFKNYCGEYPTASAFAVWLAIACINNGNAALMFTGKAQTIKHALIINQYHNINYTVTLVSAV
jgi:3-oxoacyl-[acyl-carrier-protein] synthase II